MAARTRGVALLRLDARKFDHLAPLLDLIGNELAKIAGRKHKWCGPQIGKSLLHLGMRKAGVDLLAELVNYFGRRVLGDTDAMPNARLEARQEIADGRDARQIWRASCGGYG